jgi:phage terminase small subunit
MTKAIDTDSLAMLSDLWRLYWEASDDGKVNAACKLSAKWLALAGRYGLTPADRAKLTAAPTEQRDPTELKFFSGTG